MKNIRLFLILVLMTSLSVLAQTGELPSAGLVGHWTFDDAQNLEAATVGSNLQRDTINFTGDLDGFSAADGPAQGDGAVLVELGYYYRLAHNMFPNGADPAYPDSVPSRVNRYSIVIDFKLPQTGVWYAFHATRNTSNPRENDWESFIRPEGVLGVGSTGYSYYQLTDTEGWYRLVIVADLGVQYTYYLDGQLLQDGSPRSIDDRFSISGAFDANTLLFFGDNDGEDADIYVSNLALYDRPLTLAEVENLGGYGHTVPFGDPFGEWNFTSEEDVLVADRGNDLVLTGSHEIVEGPAIGGIGAKVGSGSYYQVGHDIPANGFSGTGSEVNTYTISMDIKLEQPLVKYSLLQTNPANTTNFSFGIDEQGRFGSDELGWSDAEKLTWVIGDWYRVSLAVSQGDTSVNAMLVVDGDSIMTIAELATDGPLGLAARGGDNKLLLFADDNGDDSPISVAKLRVWNRAMNFDELRALGRYNHQSGYVPVNAKNKTFEFDGQSSYANVTDDLNFATMPAQNMTVECWVNIYKGLEWGGFIGAFQDNGDYEKGWVLGTIGGGNNYQFSFGLASLGAGPDAGDPNGSMDYIGSLAPITYDVWNHVAATYDGANMRIYVNGILLNQITTQSGPIYYDSTAFFTIGSYHDDNEFFVTPGYQDEIRLWNVALDDTTIQQWMHRYVDETHPNYDDMISYWTFDEMEGNVAPDLKGDNDATMYNMPASAYRASTVPIGESGGNFINSEEQTLVGTAGAGFNLTMLVEAGLTENIGAYVSGENDGQYVEGEPFDTVRVNVRAPLAFGAVYNGDAKAELVFEYANITGIPTDKELVLVKRDDIFATWSDDINDYAVFNTDDKTITVAADSVSGEYAIAWSVQTAISDLGLNPNRYELGQNYPNPFNPSTTIRYSIARTSDVKLVIYNVLGQRVAVIANVKNQKPGTYEVDFNAREIASGMYFYRIEAGSYRATKKMILLK